MKTILRIIVMGGIVFSLAATDVNAQGGPPPWAPAKGYRAKARYTYFPSLNFYFDTRVGVYFFLDAGIWTRRTSLPDRYRNFSWSKYAFEEFDWANNQPWEKHHGNGHNKDKGGSGHGNGKSKGKKS